MNSHFVNAHMLQTLCVWVVAVHACRFGVLQGLLLRLEDPIYLRNLIKSALIMHYHFYSLLIQGFLLLTELKRKTEKVVL